jgi:outer membrane lipoprotein-sorting protein
MVWPTPVDCIPRQSQNPRLPPALFALSLPAAENPDICDSLRPMQPSRTELLMSHLPLRKPSTLEGRVRPRASRFLAGPLACTLLWVLAAALAAPASAEKGDAKPREQAVEGDADNAARSVPAERWYAATIANDESGGFLMVHFWSKGALFRSEAVIAGRPIVTVVDHETYYIFERLSSQGVAIERSKLTKQQDATRGRPFANELDVLIRAGGELVKTTDTPSGPVDVFRATNDAGRRTVWVSTVAPRVPLRVETYDRASATTGRVEYANWIYGPEMPDEFFAPDPRVEFEKVSYAEYKKRLGRETIGPAPVLYRDLLHGHE